MKQSPIVLVCWFLSVAVCPYLLAEQDGGSIEPGFSEQQVENVLGASEGSINLGDKRVVFYRLGKVTFVDNAATNWDILTEEAYQAQQIAQQKADAAWDAAQARRQQRRIEQGLALRERTLNDPAFLISPLQEQLLFWENFIRRYPEVDVQEHYLAVKTARQAELARELEERKDERIRMLEARIAATEAKTRLYRHQPYYYRRPYRSCKENVSPFKGPWKYTYFDSYPMRVIRNSSGSTTPRKPILTLESSVARHECK